MCMHVHTHIQITNLNQLQTYLYFNGQAKIKIKTFQQYTMVQILPSNVVAALSGKMSWKNSCWVVTSRDQIAFCLPGPAFSLIDFKRKDGKQGHLNWYSSGYRFSKEQSTAPTCSYTITRVCRRAQGSQVERSSVTALKSTIVRINKRFCGDWRDKDVFEMGTCVQ